MFVAALVGLIVFTLVLTSVAWQVALLSGWNAAALTLITWTLLVVWRQDGEATARHRDRGGRLPRHR